MACIVDAPLITKLPSYHKIQRTGTIRGGIIRALDDLGISTVADFMGFDEETAVLRLGPEWRSGKSAWVMEYLLREACDMRDPAAAEARRQVLESLPNWPTLDETSRSKLVRAMYQFTFREASAYDELKQDDYLPKGVRVGKNIRMQGLALFFRERERKGLHHLPTWAHKMSSHIRQALVKMNENQLCFLRRLGYENEKSVYRKWLHDSVALLGVECEADVCGLTTDNILSILARQEKLRGIICAVNYLFNKVGRMEILDVWQVSAVRTDGMVLSDREKKWLDGRRGQSGWYRQLKQDIQDLDEPRGVKYMMLQICRALDPGSYEALLDKTAIDVQNATIPAIQEAMRDRRSLLSRKRPTGATDKSRFAPGKGATRSYCRAARLLCRLLEIELKDSDSSLFKFATVWSKVRGRIPKVGLDVVDFIDEVSGADASRAIDVASDPREKILMYLACRLGMRNGAISNLRIAGIVSSPFLRDDAEWKVRDTICGIDKGRDAGDPAEWCLSVSPGLKEALQDYINKIWRPKYERWDRQSDTDLESGRPTIKLRTGYLFPGCRWEWEAVERPLSLCSTRIAITKVLRRAGISGFNAHPHACRKGFSSDLLRTGNQVDVVAAALNHRSGTETLTQHYDKRKRSEVMANLKQPTWWNKKENGDSGVMEAESGSDSPGGSTVAAMLGEEMEMNDVMRRQLQIFEELVTPEIRDAFRARCQQEMIPPTAPLPKN